MLSKVLSAALVAIFTVGASPSLFCADLQFYSQCGQDKYVFENFFKDKKGGVFVDIGANDGVTYSNTLFFEKNLGWTGICIEPIPTVFEKLKANRKSKCIQGCISDKPGVTQFLWLNGPSEMLSGIYENLDPRHLQRINREVNQLGGSIETLQVKCYKLNDLLLDNNIKFVDYMSIDTEGGELEILKSIDFSSIDIDVIDVENNYASPEFKIFLESKGYKLMVGGQDEIYRKIKD